MSVDAKRVPWLRNQHCRSLDERGPSGLRHRLGAKDVRGPFLGDRVRFARNAGVASHARCRATSSGQSRQLGRSTSRSTRRGNRAPRWRAVHTGGAGDPDEPCWPKRPGTERRSPSEICAFDHRHSGVRQTRRHGLSPNRRDRYDRGPRLRLRSLQAI
jgi:hypothetical protein